MNFDIVRVLELTAFCFGLLYVYFAANKRWVAWLFGIISCFFWAILSYQYYQLYADALLQVFYIIMGFYGLYEWRAKSSDHILPISRLSRKEVIQYGIPSILISLAYAYYLQYFTSANLPYLDSFTTVFSILATYWMIKRKYENWTLWILLNSLYIYIYLQVEAYFFVTMMILYIILSIDGLIRWKKNLNS